MGLIFPGMKREVDVARIQMSNFKNFQKYRESCPLCKNALNLYFVSNNHKQIRDIEGKLQIEAEINKFPAPKDKKRFKIHIYLDYDTNEFNVEFLNDQGKYQDYITFNRIDGCRTLTSNTGVKFYRECGICRNYKYSSHKLNFNYRTSVIDDFSVSHEFVELSKTTKEQIRRYELSSDHVDKKSTLIYTTFPLPTAVKDLMHSVAKKSELLLEIPLIKITDPSELIQRLDTFITFS